ncbi:MAG: glycosyltransferase family 2 protein [Candidatus Thiodiazotropha sp.]
MTLLVRDEEDVLRENIIYHLSQGIDHIIVTDNLSVDSSPEIIHEFVKQGVATYISETDDNYNQSIWVSRMAQMVYEAGADWVIHCDADEFWLPPDGCDLKKWLGKLRWSNIIYADRHDFICLPSDNLPFWERMIYRKKVSLNSLGKPLPPKVTHKAYPNVTVAQGNHAVKGIRFSRAKKSGLEIMHFPLRSREQYLRKIRNGGAAYANNKELSVSVGNTWRKQYEELQSTGTIRFVEENLYSYKQLKQQLDSGEILEDRRLRNLFKKIAHASSRT